MSDTVLVTLRDGTPATLRPTLVVDAEGLVALDRSLAAAGDGMVRSADQVLSIPEERARIDAIYRRISAGSATCSVVAEVGSRVIGTADLRQLEPVLCEHFVRLDERTFVDDWIYARLLT